MSTRIRQIRRSRGMTLQEVADIVGTTAQTIQRLETGNMTVSVEWLERISRAFDLTPSALLSQETSYAVRFVGDVAADGSIQTPAPAAEPMRLAVPGDDPMAVRTRDRLGPYEPGTILVVERLEKAARRKADGRDCVVRLTSGELVFRRIVLARGGPTAYVPYDDRRGVERNLDIDWIAPVTMAVRYLDEA